MESDDNRALIREVFRGLERGDAEVLLGAMAEDISYTISGSTIFSGTVVGKKAVIEVFTAIASRLARPSAVYLDLLVADGSHAIATGRGKAVTVEGAPYDNVYCWVYELKGGRIVQVTEYLDTELVTRAFANSLARPTN